MIGEELRPPASLAAKWVYDTTGAATPLVFGCIMSSSASVSTDIYWLPLTLSYNPLLPHPPCLAAQTSALPLTLPYIRRLHAASIVPHLFLLWFYAPSRAGHARRTAASCRRCCRATVHRSTYVFGVP